MLALVASVDQLGSPLCELFGLRQHMDAEGRAYNLNEILADQSLFYLR